LLLFLFKIGSFEIQAVSKSAVAAREEQKKERKKERKKRKCELKK